ncbi:hypothetical protein ACFQEX_27065 [Roseibium salinum]|uniref:hypothetical protein n=1 Tax=Roseibium salinum TaxID=1604349 RepID=UPI0036162D18
MEGVVDMVRFPMQHDVSVRFQVLSSSSAVGETLIETAHVMQADLGGRFRAQPAAGGSVFGCTTKTPIADDSVHRFLAN